MSDSRVTEADSGLVIRLVSVDVIDGNAQATMKIDAYFDAGSTVTKYVQMCLGEELVIAAEQSVIHRV